MAGGAGDSVMTSTPIYPPFLWTPKTADMQTLQVPLWFDEDLGQWRMDLAKMESLITPRTKMFTLCNPHNPVGKVFTAQVRG
jgi:cystathionine beta-lyase